MRVNLIILGAQKCGTTTLFQILKSHPKLIGSKPKEPHFFSTNKNWRGELSAYHGLYEQKQDVMYFEGSTTYTFYPLRNLSIWNDLYEYNKDLKFIYLVRNPVDRIVSSYMHNFERGYISSPIGTALIEERLLIDITRYATQIKPFIETFGREKILILDFEGLRDDKIESTLNLLGSFLNLNAGDFKKAKEVHANKSVGGYKLHYRFDNPGLPLRAMKKLSPWLWRFITDNKKRRFKERPKLSPAQKEVVLNMLDLEITELEKIMNRDLSHWRSS